MFRTLIGNLFGKKEEAVKINMGSVVDSLARRFWEYELVDGKNDVVIVKGKYRNHQRDFSRLFLSFVGGEVQFKDERGQKITKVPISVPVNEIFPVIKNILNVI